MILWVHNGKAGREANAQKKGQLVVKLVREIMVAAPARG